MAHYAILDENNIVINVIVGADEDTDGKDWEEEYFAMFGKRCVRTSYNTYGNQHADGKEPFRKNYATIGGIYDEDLDAFYTQQPFPSWILNTETCLWEAPFSHPDNPDYVYAWDEEFQRWVPAKSIGDYSE